LDIEIISADSRQVYKHINIGTAKPTENELNTVKHHFIDFLELDENYSAGEFGNQAYKTVLDIAQRGKIPVIVGGSGLYIKGLCEGLFNEKNEIAIDVRSNLEQKLEHFGIDYLYEKLRTVDAPLYNLYDDKNPRRVLRALEYFYSNGERLSDARIKKSNRDLIFPLYFAIDFPREELYNRINQRIIQMWEMGLVQETENILNLGYPETLNSLNTVGYKETIAYLKGEISKDEAIDTIQKNTRHYAKRQLTWLNQINSILTIPIQ
jgi:tRNA dimethylallyltransferase